MATSGSFYGTKQRQHADIDRAQTMWAEYKLRKAAAKKVKR
jgi:hypothetical protein